MFVRSVAFSALSCIAFCAAAAKPETLPTPLAQQLPVELVLGQQELEVEIPNVSAGAGAQFGLLGALIGSAIENSQVKEAEARVADVRNILIDYRFNAQLERELRDRLTSEGISPNPVVAVLQQPRDEASALEATPQDVLVIAPRVVMHQTMGALIVRAHVSYYHRERKSNGKLKETARFHRSYAFRYVLAVPPAKSEKSGQGWLRLGRSGLQAIIDDGARQVADMIAYDFSVVGRAEASEKVKNDKIPFSGVVYRGRAVRTTPDYIWVRAGNGWLQTLEGYEFLDENELDALAASVGQASVAPAARVVPNSPQQVQSVSSSVGR